MLLLAFGLTTGCEDDSDGPDDTGAGTDADSGATASAETDADDTANDESGGSGASDEDVERCRNVCDSLLGVDYLEVDEHETCFTTCGQVSADEIELFYTCWLNTSGEEESRACYQNLIDADPVDPTGDDPDPTSCLDACNAYVGMGCNPPIEGATSCADFCGDLTPALQTAVVECLDGADGCDLPAACTFPGGE